MTGLPDEPEIEDSGVERAWREEIERRLFELKLGLVEPIPANDIFDELARLVE